MSFEQILESMENSQETQQEGLNVQDMPPKLEREAAEAEEAPPKMEREDMKLGETADQRYARHRLENAIASGNRIAIKNRRDDYAKTLV